MKGVVKMGTETYLSNDSIRRICGLFGGIDEKTIGKIIKTASCEAGTKTKGGAYIYKDEEKLFEVLKRFLGEQFKAYKINSFGKLVQWYVWHYN